MDNALDPEDLLGKKLPYDGGIRLESILGYGSFATVYKAMNKEGKVYAVKWLNKIGMSDRDQALQKDEVMYMKLLGEHKNIIRLYDVIETSDSLYLIMECCTTDLYELITQSEQALEIPRVKRYFNEICDGVKHCHNNHIYHRDLKPENILISDDDHCKISDFGLCCFDEWTNDFNCGSLRYMSPECIDKEEDDDDDYDDYDDDFDDNYYNGGDRRRKNEKTGLECNSRGSDVWALGVILINMIFGQNPWSSADMENPTFNMFIRKDPDVLQRKLGLSDDFNRVVKRMFSKNVFDRFSLDELRQEVNRIEVFTDFNKRVSNYLGIDEDLINMSNMAIESSAKDEDEDNSQYDEWYDDETYSNHHHNNDLVVPDIDTLELGDEESKNERNSNNDHEHNHDYNYSFDYMKSDVPFIGHWGDDLDDDEDMASELTPRVAEDEDENEEEEEKEKYISSKLMISTVNDEMSWENTNENKNSKESRHSTKINPLETNEKMEIYDYSFKDKMKEWKKEEEEDQMESEDNLMTPTVERVSSFNKGKLFNDKVNSSGKQSLSKKKSIQLRWEDLFDSDEEKKETRNSQRNEAFSPSSNVGDGEGRFHISEQALPSSWNYQQGLSWGDMMDDDDEDFMPSKPQEETMFNKSKPAPITTAFIEDSNEEDNGEEIDKEEKEIREGERNERDGGRELSFKKEKVPVSSEVSTLVTPSLLTNGMQKKLLFAAAKKSRKQEKEKKSSGKNKSKGIKEKDKDKETHRHHKSKREKEEGTGAIKIKTNGKHKHHHHKTTSSLNDKTLGKEKKSEKTSMKHHRKNNNNKGNLNSIKVQSNLELNTINRSEDKLSVTDNTPFHKHNHTSSKIIKSNKNKNNKNNNNKIHKHHKNEHNQKLLAVKSNNSNSKSNIDNTTKIHKTNSINTTSSITTNKPASVQLDWEDLFSSDGEERTLTTADSIKTNDKSFSIDETLEAEDEIFSLSNNIKALDIENEKNHKDSTTVNKMVDSAISVSETNLSKEKKNLNLH